MPGQIAFSDVYGYSGGRSLNVPTDETTAAKASGDIQSGTVTNSPAFSWLALVILLVVIRVIWEMAE